VLFINAVIPYSSIEKIMETGPGL